MLPRTPFQEPRAPRSLRFRMTKISRVAIFLRTRDQEKWRSSRGAQPPGITAAEAVEIGSVMAERGSGRLLGPQRIFANTHVTSPASTIILPKRSGRMSSTESLAKSMVRAGSGEWTTKKSLRKPCPENWSRP